MERDNICKPTIGNESFHHNSNDNGVRIVNFATLKNLVLKSTMFPHRNIHKYNWTFPDRKTHNQIDHILIDRRWLRWSRGSVLAFSTQVRGFKPGRSRRIFSGEKIPSTPSFGGEVKPSVPCRRFTACKRSLNGVEVVISAKLPDNILAHSSNFRRWDLSRRGRRGGTWW